MLQLSRERAYCSPPQCQTCKRKHHPSICDHNTATNLKNPPSHPCISFYLEPGGTTLRVEFHDKQPLFDQYEINPATDHTSIGLQPPGSRFTRGTTDPTGWWQPARRILKIEPATTVDCNIWNYKRRSKGMSHFQCWNIVAGIP